MNSQTNKLIEVMKRRLTLKKRNTYRNNEPISIFRLRYSNQYQETNVKTPHKSKKKYFLTEDHINLKIMPLLKKKKCAFTYESLLKMKKEPTKDTNISKSVNKLNNGRNNDSSANPSKSSKALKKFIFRSPFQENKNNSKRFKILVDISKEIHSPKEKENKLNKDLLRTFARNSKKEYFENKKNLGYLKTYGNENHIFNDIKINEKSNKLNNSKFFINNMILQNQENILLRNLIINKERNRRAKNYYNNIHVNKIDKIIEKYSFTNRD